MIGELYQSFVFDTDCEAKRAWERVVKRCRYISVNRWIMYPLSAKAQMVTILGERTAPSEPSYNRARLMLTQMGKAIDTPEATLSVMRERRANSSGRRTVRSRHGVLIASDGTSLGPMRRGQG